MVVTKRVIRNKRPFSGIDKSVYWLLHSARSRLVDLVAVAGGTLLFVFINSVVVSLIVYLGILALLYCRWAFFPKKLKSDKKANQTDIAHQDREDFNHCFAEHLSAVGERYPETDAELRAIESLVSSAINELSTNVERLHLESKRQREVIHDLTSKLDPLMRSDDSQVLSFEEIVSLARARSVKFH